MKRRYIIPEQISKLLPQKLSYKEETEKFDFTLIALRRQFLKLTKDEKKLQFKILHFQKVIKTKEIEDIADLIKVYLREDNFGCKN